MRPIISVDLAGVELPTPVMVASGCFSREIAGLVDIRKFGGIVTGSVTLSPRKGVSTPRIAETPSGLLAQTGAQNPGVDAFLREELPALSALGVPVFVSVAASTVDELMRLTMTLQSALGITALEVNACFPSRQRDGRAYSATAEGASEAVGAVARLTRLPVFAKLSPETGDLIHVAQSCVAAGAHGITLIHSLTGMVLDVEAKRPVLAAGSGWLSGPAVRPVGVQAVARVARALPKVPLIGVGGIATGRDALEYMMAGAWAVQVGTAMFSNPNAPIEVAQGILRHVREKGLAGPADLRAEAAAGVASTEVLEGEA